ncbi:MAG: sugar kinase, partial [Candidatus Brocadiia bacterium]
MDWDLLTFGEAMIRLTPPDHMRLEQADALQMTVGGAEWNVAVNVSRLGLSTAWVSRLVDNWSGRFIVQQARTHGVDTGQVVWTEFDGVGRVRNGFYHLELGAGPRASSVTYDRGHSAVSLMEPDMADWAALMDGCRWFHSTGITPALSPALRETTLAAFQAAAAAGVRTSYDLNYRAKLRTPEEAQETNAQVV